MNPEEALRTDFLQRCEDAANRAAALYHHLDSCATTQQLADTWTTASLCRHLIQDECEDLITEYPDLANECQADKILWRYVFYVPIAECRKYLRLDPSMAGSALNADDGYAASIVSLPANDDSDLWRNQWWAMTLHELLCEAIGYMKPLFMQQLGDISLTSLQIAMRHIRGQTRKLSPRFDIARRLMVYIGDVHRYQHTHQNDMYVHEIVFPDTCSFITLARNAYACAHAMHFNSGRACEQMALLSLYENDPMGTMFWQTSALCYSDHLQVRNKSMLLAMLLPGRESSEQVESVEHSVLELAYAVLCTSEPHIQRQYKVLVQALQNSLDSERDPVADGMWEDGYRSSVIMAALLTWVVNSPTLEGNRTDYMAIIQHIAVMLLLNQLSGIHQTLAAGESATYALLSLVVWVDIWRSSPYLETTLTSAHVRFPTLSTHLESLFALLVRLTRDLCADAIQLSRTANLATENARALLPSDITLLGWTTLQASQRDLNYEELLELPEMHLSAKTPTVFTGHSKPGARTNISVSSYASSDSEDMPLWAISGDLLTVAFSRSQLMILTFARRGVLPFLVWDTDGDVMVESEQARAQRHIQMIQAMADTKLAEQQRVQRDELRRASVSPQPSKHPVYVPDVDSWCFHLPALRGWLRTHQPTLVFGISVLREIDIAKTDHKIGYRARAVSQFIDATRSWNKSTVVLQSPDQQLENWACAAQYMCSEDFEDATMMDDEEMVDDRPDVEEVPEPYRGILSCALYFAHVAQPEDGAMLVTDDEELAFYATWFGIDCVSPKDQPAP